MMLEVKQFEVQDFALKDNEFVGYAATWDIDKVKDRFEPGAFSETKDFFLKHGFITTMHNFYAIPVAYPVDLTEDDKGLMFVGRFHNTPEAKAVQTVVRERIEAGKVVPLSVGFETIEDEITNEVRVIKKAKLYEISFVNVPANDNAQLLVAKDYKAEYTVHQPAIKQARALIRAGKVDYNSAWEFTSADRRKLFSDVGEDWEKFSLWFLAQDTSADPETFQRYKFPYGKNGKVYRRAVIAAKTRAAQNNYDNIVKAADALLQYIDKMKKYFDLRNEFRQLSKGLSHKKGEQ